MALFQIKKYRAGKQTVPGIITDFSITNLCGKINKEVFGHVYKQ